MSDGYKLSEGAVRRSAETARRVLGSGQDLTGGRPSLLTSGHVELEGILQDDLAAADDPITGKATAELKLLTASDDDNGVELSDETVTVTNRSPQLSATKGDLVRVTYVNGEFRPIVGGCDCCDRVFSLDILSENIQPPNDLLFYFRPAYWEFAIAHFGGIFQATDVNSASDELTIHPDAFRERQTVRMAVTDGTLPSPLQIATDYYVINSGDSLIQLSATEDGPPIDLTDDGSGAIVVKDESKPFRLWFRTGHWGADPYAVRAISQQFAFKYQGIDRLAHWEYVEIPTNTSGPGPVRLVIDEPVDMTAAPVLPLIYGLPEAIVSTAPLQPLEQRKLKFLNRQNTLGRNDPELLRPLADLPVHICLTPHKYPDTIRDDSPLKQLWGATPPASLSASYNSGAPVTIGYRQSGKVDCFAGGNGATAHDLQYEVRAVMDGDDVVTDKVMLLFSQPIMPAFAMWTMPYWMKIVDFAAPLDVTIEDTHGNTLRFWE